MRLFRKSSSTRKSLELRNRLGTKDNRRNNPKKKAISKMVKYEPPSSILYYTISIHEIYFIY